MGKMAKDRVAYFYGAGRPPFPPPLALYPPPPPSGPVAPVAARRRPRPSPVPTAGSRRRGHGLTDRVSRPSPARARPAVGADDAVSEVYYGANHPMKPPRIAMAHHLVVGYDLHQHMQVFRPRRATPAELAQFHTEDYVSFLQVSWVGAGAGRGATSRRRGAGRA